MFTRNFLKLSSVYNNLVISDEDIREAYLDSLASLDDLLCQFLPYREPPRECNPDFIIQYIQDNLKIIGHKSIKHNIADNLDIALDLRREAAKIPWIEARRSIEMDIKLYL